MFSLKKTLFLIFTFILLSSALYSGILNVPYNWSTIQAGIDAAIDADTVLVQPGTYYENINYNGKHITIGSLFLMTQDSAYIASTIIDGSNDGRVVTINSGENDTAVLSGFTITNGYASGTSDTGGGIFIYGSSPTLENLIVTNNEAVHYGGGIYCYESSSSLSNSIISNNITSQGGGGIVCHSNSNMSLYNVKISDNSAYRRGGISCKNSDMILENVTITGNTVTDEGGGIYFSYSNSILENVTIAGNTAVQGGGIYCAHSEMSLTNCILWNDTPEEIYVPDYGNPCTITVAYIDIEDGQAGIVANGNTTVNWLDGNINSNPMFVNPNVSDYHLQANSPCIDAGDPSSPLDPDGTIADMGAFYFNQAPVADFTADTTIGIPPLTVNFTDLSTQGMGAIDEWYWDFGDGNNSTLQDPSNEYQDYGNYTVSLTVTNISDFTDTIIKEEYILVNPTGYNGPVWHISTTGSDEWGNGSEELPFATIQHGIDVSADADTVLVQPGTYVENVYFDGNLVTVGSFFLTTGDSDYISYTIIDGNNNPNVVSFGNVNSSTVLCGFTITNASGGNYGGGVHCFEASPTLKNLIVTGNSSLGGGGGIQCNNSDPIIKDVTIMDNSAGGGGGILCWNANPILENVTISGNTAEIGGGAIFCNSSSPILVNCITWNNSPEEIFFYVDFDPNAITVSYSDIEGGEAEIVTNNNGTVNWLDGNIDMDPMFVDAISGDYHLLFASPCIDAGDPNSIYDPDGTIADMGAWFYDHGNAIEDNEIQHVEFNLSNYPNPFNPLTTIEFDIKEFEVGVLSIFNIKGQLIETHKFEAGQHDFQWDASNQASGVYLYKLKTESSTVNKKMLLLK